MGIDKPSTGSDSAPDRPREPEYPVPRRENPAARERPATPQAADAPTSRQERAADAEERRLARIARRAEAAASSESRPEAPTKAAHSEARAEARPEAGREPRPGDKGVITHFRGPTVDLYTDGTRWASGDVIRHREAEHQRREGISSEGTKPTTGVPSMSQYGRDTIGVRPDDAADLPPERKELMETDDSDHSLTDRLRRRVEDDEVLGDFHDQSVEQGNLWHQALDGNQPQGHPVQVQRDSPQAIPSQQSHPLAGDVLGGVIAFGVMADRGAQALHRLLTHKKEVD